MAISARSRNMLTLYSGKLCLRSHQVRLVLAAKGVTYDLVLVDPARPPEDLIDLNPYQSVPTLVDRDLVLHDVDVVCDYIDERYPHPPLMPVDPSSRARLRMAERRVEWEWLPLVEEIQTGAKAQADKARRHLRDAMTASAPVFKAAKFFLNTEMSIADCLLAPLVWLLVLPFRLLGLVVGAVFALLRAAQPAPSVADGMARYLRSARSRGVPQSVCDEVLALVEDAELLGYFLASETAPSTSPLQAQAAHEDQSH